MKQYFCDLVLLYGAMTLYIILFEVVLRVLHTFILTLPINIFDIRCSNLMDDVRIWLMSLVSFFILEKTDLTGFAELSYIIVTCLRLLLRFQLSSPWLERCSAWVDLVGNAIVFVSGASKMVYGRMEGLWSKLWCGSLRGRNL